MGSLKALTWDLSEALEKVDDMTKPLDKLQTSIEEAMHLIINLGAGFQTFMVGAVGLMVLQCLFPQFKWTLGSMLGTEVGVEVLLMYSSPENLVSGVIIINFILSMMEILRDGLS